MRYKLLAALVFISCGLQAQQVNPVPDYVFQNRMSVGRTTVTDTLAYFSMGPRYGAIRGFMPPMVVDTALVTGGTKRNGLTIFSIQKNKYMYWDSVRVQWSDFAGSSGAYIFASDTASMLSPYIRAAGYGLTKSGQSLIVDTAAMATRARVQKAVDSLGAAKQNVIVEPIGGIGATGYIPVYKDTLRIGNSVVFQNSGSIGINTTTPAGLLEVKGDGISVFTRGTKSLLLNANQVGANTNALIDVTSGMDLAFASGTSEHFRLTSGGEILVKTTSDAGNYVLQVAGTIYNTTGAILAATSGSVGIGTTSPQGLFEVVGAGVSYFTRGTKSILINPNQVGANTNALIDVSSGMDLAFATNTSERMRITSAGEILIGTTTDAGAYALQVAGSIYNTTTLTTGAPTSGTAKPWRLGEAATVSPTSPNRTIRVEIDGTVYYIHAKTTND